MIILPLNIPVFPPGTTVKGLWRHYLRCFEAHFQFDRTDWSEFYLQGSEKSWIERIIAEKSESCLMIVWILSVNSEISGSEEERHSNLQLL